MAQGPRPKAKGKPGGDGTRCLPARRDTLEATSQPDCQRDQTLLRVQARRYKPDAPSQQLPARGYGSRLLPRWSHDQQKSTRLHPASTPLIISVHARDWTAIV